MKTSGEPLHLIINPFYSLTVQNYLTVGSGRWLDWNSMACQRFKVNLSRLLSVFARELSCCWRLRWAVLRDTRTTRKRTLDRAPVPSASQSSKAEFYATRDVISRVLSVAVLRSQVYSLRTPHTLSFATVGLLVWAFFFSTLPFHSVRDWFNWVIQRVPLQLVHRKVKQALLTGKPQLYFNFLSFLPLLGE